MEPMLSSLIASAEGGDRSATDALFTVLYSELHRMAQALQDHLDAGDGGDHVECVGIAQVGDAEDLAFELVLAAGAGYEHADWSRSERIGSSVLHRCLTRSSAQQRPCSSGAAASYSSVT